MAMKLLSILLLVVITVWASLKTPFIGGILVGLWIALFVEMYKAHQNGEI